MQEDGYLTLNIFGKTGKELRVNFEKRVNFNFLSKNFPNIT